MKRVYRFIFSVLLAILFFNSCGKNGKVEYLNLKSGIRVVFQEEKSPVTSAVFLIGAGNSVGTTQTADIMNKLIFEGSSIRTRQQIFQEIEALGGRIMYWTDDATSLIQIRSPSKNFERCFSIVCETISHPLFDKDHIDRVLKEKLSKEGKISNVRLQIKRDVRGLLFAGSVLADSAEFSENEISSYSLKEYYEKYYFPSNIVIAVSGDFNSNSVLKMISSCWKSHNGKENHRTGKIKKGVLAAQREVVRHLSSEEGRLIFAFRAPGILEKDYFNMRLLNQIIADNLNSILKDALIENGINSSRLSSYYFRDYGFGYFVIEAKTGIHDLEKTRRIITNRIESIRRNGIPERYFVIGKRKVISHIVYRMQFSGFKADVLAFLVFTGYPDLSFSSYYNQFKKLNLTGVNKAAKSIFLEPVIIKYIPK